MENLTQERIGLIRIALIEQIKSNSIHADGYASLLSSLEYGCSVCIKSCDETSREALDVSDGKGTSKAFDTLETR